MKRLTCYAAAFCLLVIASGCASLSVLDSQSTADWEEVYWISMIEAIANPERYDGKVIMLAGFLHVDPVSEEKGGYLYLHRDDYEKWLTKNAVAVALSDPSGAMKWDKKYVTIEGTFQAIRRTGRFPYAGTLWKIKRITPRPAELNRADK